MKPVLVVGDSLGCPRPSEGVGLAETYAYKLQEALGSSYYVLNLSVGENNSRKINNETFLRNYVEGSTPEIVIIQIGIVDCAPRLMSLLERFIGGVASRVPGLRGIFALYARLKARYRHRLTRWFPRTLVTLKEYHANMNRFVSALRRLPSVKHVFVINIADVSEALAAKSYGIRRNIGLFNDTLASLESCNAPHVIVIDLNQATAENPHWITPADGHHIYGDAHAWIAGQIEQHLARHRVD